MAYTICYASKQSATRRPPAAAISTPLCSGYGSSAAVVCGRLYTWGCGEGGVLGHGMHISATADVLGRSRGSTEATGESGDCKTGDSEGGDHTMHAGIVISPLMKEVLVSR